MKKVNLLSKAEMKKVMGGVPLESYCSESEYYAHCDISIPLEQGGWSYGSFEGCIEKTNYENMAANPNNRCRILGNGGPYPL